MQWLNHEGLGEYSFMSPQQDAIIVQASIKQIEKLLSAEYSLFGMKKTLSRWRRSSDFYI
jgi:tripeptidyl-peptidase I